jgi:hypothetical protein
MKNIRETVIELRKGLDFINTGMFVSILPDEIIDLNPSDEEIAESVGYTLDELSFAMLGKLYVQVQQADWPDTKTPRNINDVLWNVLVHCWYEIKRAVDCTTERRIPLMLETCQQCEDWLNSIYPEED